MKKTVLGGILRGEILCRLSAILFVLCAASIAEGVTLRVDQVRQRYPWNGLVDIDYTIISDAGVMPGVDDNLEVLMVDLAVEPAVTNRAVTFLQAPLPLTAGSHRITWDANADGVTYRTDQAEIHVSVVHYAEAYMVIDVSEGSSATTYPVDFLNGAPINGFNVDEYKGDKIVLRRIHPGSYIAGSPANEANRRAVCEQQHQVTLSQPFYMGIFEVTQQQYVNVMGVNPSSLKDPYCPVEQVSYSQIRGTANITTHQYDWPLTNEVDSTSFIGRLLQKCKSRDANGQYTIEVTGFDLPTDFQWEYACRAGTVNALNTTNDFNNSSSSEQIEQMRLLGRFSSNQTDGRGSVSGHHTTVGSYLPNAWGLYDMLGNVWEWCLDWGVDDASSLGQLVNPKGPASGIDRVLRGGCYYDTITYCRSASRYRYTAAKTDAGGGFRLSRTLP